VVFKIAVAMGIAQVAHSPITKIADGSEANDMPISERHPTEPEWRTLDLKPDELVECGKCSHIILGRERVLYYPLTDGIYCEKCGRNAADSFDQIRERRAKRPH
jgi:hypothetical protein